MTKFKSRFLLPLPFVVGSALAADGYTVPAGVTTAISDAQAAATGLANAAIPAVSQIALAFVGLVVVWLIVKAIRRGAK